MVRDWRDVPKRAGEKRRKDGEVVAFYLSSTALVPERLSAVCAWITNESCARAAETDREPTRGMPSGGVVGSQPPCQERYLPRWRCRDGERVLLVPGGRRDTGQVGFCGESGLKMSELSRVHRAYCKSIPAVYEYSKQLCVGRNERISICSGLPFRPALIDPDAERIARGARGSPPVPYRATEPCAKVPRCGHCE